MRITAVKLPPVSSSVNIPAKVIPAALLSKVISSERYGKGGLGSCDRAGVIGVFSIVIGFDYPLCINVHTIESVLNTPSYTI